MEKDKTTPITEDMPENLQDEGLQPVEAADDDIPSDKVEISVDELNAIRDTLSTVERMLSDDNRGNTFLKRRTYMADRKEAKALYASELDKVITPESMSIKTFEQKKKEEIHVLMEAARSESGGFKILNGQLMGVHENSDGGIIAEIYLLEEEGYDGIVPIYIPVQHLFEYDPKSYEMEEHGHQYLRRAVENRMGSLVRFCVFVVDEKEGVAIGSRLQALSIDAQHNYRNNKNDGIPKYVKGCYVPARVTSIFRDRLYVECMGAEACVKSGRDLSWNSLQDLREEFEVNQTFFVKILDDDFFNTSVSVRVDTKTYNLVHLHVSKTAAEHTPADLYYDRFKIGQRVMGVVKNDATAAGLFVTLQNKMDCICPIPAAGSYHMGDKVIVKIVKKDDEKKRLIGLICA